MFIPYLGTDSLQVAIQLITPSHSHHAKTDLNKKSGAMHQTLIFFNIDAQGFRKTKNEYPRTREMGVAS